MGDSFIFEPVKLWLV